MSLNKWNDLDDKDKEIIINFVSANINRVKEDVRNLDSNIYSGNMPMEVAATWVIMRGKDYIDDFINKK